MKRSFAILGLFTLFIAASPAAFAVTEFDQNITPTVIFGSGVTDGAWTTERGNGLEIGLRSKLRYDDGCQPQNVFNSNGNGTYSFLPGVATNGTTFADCSSPATPIWSFEWSVNTDFDNSSGLEIDAYTYEIGLDTDPTVATSFCTWDNIIPGVVPAWDHAIGDNSTTIGGGTTATGVANYATLINTNNVAQNSWRYDFFDAGSTFDPCGFVFDPNVEGKYDIYLRVLDVSGAEVARSTIQMDIRTPQLPSNSTLSLLALFAGLALVLAFGVRRFSAL